MSTPDARGESLESILASIRRSLAEQSTGVLDEGPVAASDAPAGVARAQPVMLDLDSPPIPESLSHQLAETVPAAPAPTAGPLRALLEAASAAEEAASASAAAAAVSPTAIAAVMASRTVAPTAEVSPASEPAPVAFTAAQPPIPEPIPAEPVQAVQTTQAPAQPAGAAKDPLWFLGYAEESKPAADATGPTVAAASPIAVPAVAPAPLAAAVAPRPAAANPQPKPAGVETKARTGIVRGPLPPFFGASVEAVNVEIAPEPPILTASVQPVAPQPAAAAGSINGASHGGGLQAPPPGWPHTFDAGSNGSPDHIPGPAASGRRADGPADAPADDGRALFGEGLPQTQGLEIMVAELLRPMLRRWLDENMPRLVSAALKAELAERDRKKS